MSLKIAYFMDVWEHLGGSTNHLLRHALIIKKLDIENVIVIPDTEYMRKDSPLVNRCKEYGLNYIFIEYKTSTDFINIDFLSANKHVEKIINFIIENKITFLHSVQLNLAVEMASRRLNVPHLMSIYQIEEEAFNIKYPHIFPRYIHSDSYLYTNIWSHGLENKGTCIRSWIPEHQFVKANTDSTIITIIVSGIISARKGQLKVIELIKVMKTKGIEIKLILCGHLDPADNYYQQCLDYINKYNLKQNVELTGFVNNIEEYMNRAQVLICASDNESFPQVVLEAMAMKIPVICTPVAGIPEIIKDGYNGYLSEGFETKDICEAFIRFYSDYTQGESRIVDNAYESFKQESSFEAVSSKLLSLYKETIRDHKSCVLLNNEQIENCEEDLRDIISLIEEKKDTLMNYKFIYEHAFYIFFLYKHIKSLIPPNQCVKVAIWGASKAGQCVKEIIDNFYSELKICVYIDEFKKGYVNNIPIVPKEELDCEEIQLIFIATSPGKADATCYLNEKGKRLNYDYFYFV